MIESQGKDIATDFTSLEQAFTMLNNQFLELKKDKKIEIKYD